MEAIVKVYALPSIKKEGDDIINFSGTVYFVAADPLALGDVDSCYILKFIHDYCKIFNPKTLLKEIVNLCLYSEHNQRKLDRNMALLFISIAHKSSTDVSKMIANASLIGEYKVDKELMDYLFGEDWRESDYKSYNYEQVLNYFKDIYNQHSTF